MQIGLIFILMLRNYIGWLY